MQAYKIWVKKKAYKGSSLCQLLVPLSKQAKIIDSCVDVRDSLPMNS